MILEFKVRNFRSISDWESFSMLAEGKVGEHPENLADFPDLNVLRTAMIYGRNASGKSNLLRAFAAFEYLVVSSDRFKADQIIPPYEPFLLNKNGINEPIEFSLEFMGSDSIRYIYSIGFTDKEITYENLIYYPKKQSALLFDRRHGKKIKYSDQLLGRKKDIENLLYPNQLFLSKVGTEKIDKLKEVYKFFTEKIYISNIHDTDYEDALVQVFSNKLGENSNPFFTQNINTLMRVADTGIEELTIKEEDASTFNFPKDMSDEKKKEIIERFKYKIRTVHKRFDGDTEMEPVEMRLTDESTGTKKLLAIGGLIIEALEIGQVLIIDEIDKSLHPKLTRALIKLFHCKKNNPKNAQLIFATHDVSLLDNEIFRRDQIWFAEKEYEGNSHYYSLSDVPGVRANVPFEKYYMSGRFGATPVINTNELSFQY
ncbi:AAA family ATPase [Flavobacterium mesophilum]|uniref:AAA family ATPase n=1 Tax=Flavobacterium mesophilum TaxID=3143495 RepID=UPI0031CDC749